MVERGAGGRVSKLGFAGRRVFGTGRGEDVQSAKSRLYFLLFFIMRDAENLVEIAVLPELVVGFVDCVE